MEKSSKPIKLLEEIIVPFEIKPDEDIVGGINGDNFHFPANKATPMTYPQYENLMSTPYAKYLKY